MILASIAEFIVSLLEIEFIKIIVRLGVYGAGCLFDKHLTGSL